ncbi:B12-binding domain-containing radical SAM protein [Thiobacter aerophilum]|uniref:DUF4080 domain-containing protein n=1 Tax=Thiobacter aerophilum TaxID=3121275 RepID=A0ABV0EEK3_9BURK
MATIVLATLNARHTHASLGLRYLLANLGPLAEQATLMEFTIARPVAEVVEAILAARPRIVGLGVYIWNVEQTSKLVAMLKRVAPEVTVVLGGPEVSHETETQPIVDEADYVITGWGEVSFRVLCEGVLSGQPPAQKIIPGEQPALRELSLPYALYTEEDIAHRFLYVEASRGCPYKCEFCLSALDKTAWAFPQDAFLAALDALYQRGARHFRFVDRTFNLNVKSSLGILEFFLARLDAQLFLHFEVIPDHLPDALKAALVRFPPGSLQLEIGVQTFDPTVQALISRRQDNARTEENLRWLKAHTHAHLHVDLIAGLPGEDLSGFGAGFDRLVALAPHEIQVELLKRLRGAPIARHTERFGLRFNPHPPYEILATDRIGFTDMRRLARFARYWDLLGNSGRFRHTLPLMLGEAPFARFLNFSDWLWRTAGQTHGFALERLFALVAEGLTQVLHIAPEAVRAALAADYATVGAGALPGFLRGPATKKPASPDARRARQARHRAASSECG